MVRIVAYLPGPSGDPGTERCHALPAKMKERPCRANIFTFWTAARSLPTSKPQRKRP